ncbi:cytokinin dehydrogenase 3-like [Diospyros lotus]|uniref:cytokinin dehydrogenase 3-like n=1 Tax=Diospyros lotus TaxID=55363 RepID=UPI00224D7ECA|nr:cytokinin dehydrogenase 3-like [Diospyros lotus]
MPKAFPTSFNMVLFAIISFLVFSISIETSSSSSSLCSWTTSFPCPWTTSLPPELLTLDIANRFHTDKTAIESASIDFGKLVRLNPAAVLNPSSVQDIVNLVEFSYNSPIPFSIAAKGRGHSVRGQAMAKNGVVVEMEALKHHNNEIGIRVLGNPKLGFYADVGGGHLWIDILLATLGHGLAPVSWTDYLFLSIGGTLSNAGISGQSFRFGPQISNVYEMDIITGKGELVTCSKRVNSDLFYAVLGGLGQFGIITRARIALQKAPNRVKWIRMLYEDFSSFTRDQEHLISIDGPDYVEGSLIMNQSPPNNWRSSFFSPSDQSRISSLLTKHTIIYCLEVVKYYDYVDNLTNINTTDEGVEALLKGLSFLPGFFFKKEESFVGFLNRVRSGELELQAKGKWDVPHPWLNLFVPTSRIMDFNAGVFVDILSKQSNNTGPILVYPLNRNKWDERTSAVIPAEEEEETFYTIGVLGSSEEVDMKILENQNKEILEFCEKAGIGAKQYFPHYTTKKDWMNHFGSRWGTFLQRKAQYDPRMILSPGQRIFTSI